MPNDSFWVMKCKLNQNSRSIKNDDKQSESILLKREYVDSLLEYAPNHLIVTIKPKDLLIVVNWKVTHLIVDFELENIDKFMLKSMPGFDLETFPFIVCSGTK